MPKTYDRNRPGYAADRAEARPAAIAYDPYFPVIAQASADRGSHSASPGHTVFDPYRPRRGHRPEF